MTVDQKNYIRTLRLKVRSEAYQWLNGAALEVNRVWNYSNMNGVALKFEPR